MKYWKAEDPLGVVHRFAMPECGAVIFGACDYENEGEQFVACQYEIMSTHARATTAENHARALGTVVVVEPEEDNHSTAIQFLDLLQLTEHHAISCGSKHVALLRRELVAYREIGTAIRMEHDA